MIVMFLGLFYSCFLCLSFKKCGGSNLEVRFKSLTLMEISVLLGN